MPRCTCLHAGDRHAERNAGLAPPDEDETVFPCLDCGCGDYDVELVGGDARPFGFRKPWEA